MLKAGNPTCLNAGKGPTRFLVHHNFKREKPMLDGKSIIVVLPAYNAAQTLEKTVAEIDRQVVDEILLVDDFSMDNTVELAKKLGIRSFLHDRNYGYGRNQKTCYREALNSGADVVVMLHPDYQYSPKLGPAMAAMVVSGEYDLVLGSRILGGRARSSGMPLYKYVANRFLTLVENLMLGCKLSEFHTGYRAFSRSVLENLPLGANSDDFVFDNEMLAQAVHFNYRLGEVSCPTRYFAAASSINFRRSVVYGFGVLWTSLRFRMHRWGLCRFAIFEASSASAPFEDYYGKVQ